MTKNVPIKVRVGLQQMGEELPVPAGTEALVDSAVQAALTVAGFTGPETELSVLLTDDPGISKLHLDFMGDDSPTDVLSWSAREETGGGEPELLGGPDERLLGDIVLSVDTARAQAEQYGQSVEREIALLVVHGVLHILGFDDCDDDTSKVMRATEQKALLLVP